MSSIDEEGVQAVERMFEPKIRAALELPTPDESDNHLVELPPEQFAVTDFKGANWVVLRVKQARDYAAMVKQWAAVESRKAQEAEAFFLNSFGDQLKALAQQTTEGTKKRSINLIAGRVQLRKTPLKLEIVDEEAYRMWAEKSLPFSLQRRGTIECTGVPEEQLRRVFEYLNRQGIAVGTDLHSPTVIKSVVNEHFKTSGEVPAGCEVRGGEDEVYIQ